MENTIEILHATFGILLVCVFDTERERTCECDGWWYLIPWLQVEGSGFVGAPSSVLTWSQVSR